MKFFKHLLAYFQESRRRALPVSPGLAPWNKSSSELLKQFLSTPVGRQFLLQLADHRPPLVSASSDVNQVALAAAEAVGFERAYNTILSLATPPVEESPETEHYPSLDDDSKWTEPKQ
ncbi:MAG TPA: hypothetical protein VEH04_16850 [Verrucomicrobiae bacterium]|nr:hypothetical protein [Verrucomicrobiae bacterium]